MTFVNFYFDKPFNAAVKKEKIRHVISDCNTGNKPYPKSILNEKQTTLYLFFSYELNKKFKIRINDMMLPEQWDFKKGKYKSSVRYG